MAPLARTTSIRSGAALAALALGTKDVTGATPGLDEVIDITHIVFGLAHVSEAGATGALGPAPDDLDTQHGGAVDFKPHLDAELGQVVAQQDRGVDPGPPDR